MTQEDTDRVRDFFQGWMLYWRVVDQDYLGHREIYLRLKEFLSEHYPEPYRLLDCGCGDSSYMVKGLVGTRITAYTGIDLSENALELARQNLEGLGFALELIPGDYAEIIGSLPIRPNVIWIGLSMHHLPLEQKRIFLKRCRQKLAMPGGHVLFFEPMLAEGETREEHVERWWATCRDDWSVIGEKEKISIREHVLTADFPESHATYRRLGEEAGFHGADLLLTDAKNIYAMLALRAVA